MSDKRWELIDGVWLYGGKKLTATPAIHQHCINECCYTAQEVTKCDNRKCALWGFRTGKGLNVKNTTTHRPKDAQGKYLPINNGKKTILQGVGDDYTVPEGYEVVIRRKHKEKK